MNWFAQKSFQEKLKEFKLDSQKKIIVQTKHCYGKTINYSLDNNLDKLEL